ncbi:MAG: NAD+ synthase [Sphingomonadales bacterium]
MTDHLKIALAQLNPTVGDLDGNFARIREARAAAMDADLVVFSELVTTGYPPEDLVLKPAFQAENETLVRELAAITADGGPGMIVGSPWREDGKLYNAALLLDGGDIQALRFKHALPNYGVFDEKRVFEAGPVNGPMNFRGVRLGVMTCEDMWVPEVTECLEETGAELLVVINGSPFEIDKIDDRITLAVARVVESRLPLIYVNQVGGQDELVFDGSSFILNPDRSLTAQLPAWREATLTSRWRRDGEQGWLCETTERTPHAEGLAAIYQAMTLGLRDYVRKNRFPGVIIGLSGGIDSALSVAVAVDALGPDAVHCVMMPSKFTSPGSLEDASGCARALGVRLDDVSIEQVVAAFDTSLASMFSGLEPDSTEENIQARARGLLLMAISNKFGYMVLTTGNKSEMSVGYATLYGDMCGGYSVLKDVYKTTVYELADWRNRNLPEGALGPQGPVIPENILTKAPTAELRPDQTDQDSLPPYDHLDDILRCFVEREMAIDEIVARGHARDIVTRVEHMLFVAEYKRRQAPPGVKITSRNFGRDRRYPITNGFRDALRRSPGEWN